MNMIEACKLAHEGWVRSPSITGNKWVRVCGVYWNNEKSVFEMHIAAHHIDSEDWEPKPAPAKPFEADVYIHPSGLTMINVSAPLDGWRRIRVREVTE